MLPISPDLIERIEQRAALQGENALSGLASDEGLRLGVVQQQIVVDQVLDVVDAGVSAATVTLFGDLRAEELHKVQLGPAGGREMQLEAGMLFPATLASLSGGLPPIVPKLLKSWNVADRDRVGADFSDLSRVGRNFARPGNPSFSAESAACGHLRNGWAWILQPSRRIVSGRQRALFDIQLEHAARAILSTGWLKSNVGKPKYDSWNI